ncbi:GGDEF domain-containing protein [Rhizobium wuzhouense]|nr:GGDEF domain-containing protein [Rhizobium wuzhouense]
MELTLHLPTILVVHGMATLISTLLCAYMWARERPNVVLAMLVLAGASTCAGMALHGCRTILPLPLASGVGLGLAILGAGLYWQAVAAFEGRDLSKLKSGAGGVIWLFCWLVPAFQDSVALRGAVLGLLIAPYCLLTARDIWRGRIAEPLPSRTLAVVANALRGLVWFLVLPLSLLIAPPYAADGGNAHWFALVALINSLLIVLSLISLLILAKERDERRYRLASERDPLTNLANRRTFVMTAQSILAREEGKAALLLFDLDHFKHINDTHGHATGDQVLRAFSRAIEKRMPKSWIFARIGGEEFACLLPRASGQQGLAIAENFRQAIAGMHEGGATHIPITVSIGVSTSSDPSVQLDTLLAEADAALYKAKADGRNCVRLHDPVVMVERASLQLEPFKVAMHGHPVARTRRRGSV